METRVMISPPDRMEPKLRVEADLGLGFSALPVFEQERTIDRVLEDARSKLVGEMDRRRGAA